MFSALNNRTSFIRDLYAYELNLHLENYTHFYVYWHLQMLEEFNVNSI